MHRMSERNRMGKAGLVLGIITLVLGLLFTPVWPGLGVYVILCVAVGLALSGVAFYQAQKSGTPIDIAIAGLVVNAIALAMIFVISIWAFTQWES